MRCRGCSGVTGRRFVRRTTGWCQAVRGPGPSLQIVSARDEVRVEPAGDVALQGAHDLAGGASFGESTRDVFAGAFIAGHAGEHDPPESMVRLSVAAAVEPEAFLGLARRRGNGRDTTEVRERCFVRQSVRVVAGGDE